MRFPIQLGDLSVDHEVYDTDAPVDYDGFGTFAVAWHDNTRTVLIRSEHLTWQLMRYQSGNHAATETDHNASDISDALWNRLRGQKILENII